MSRRHALVLILGVGATCAAAEDVDILRAYIDPGVAGFIVVTVLGFISSIGYWARSYVGRVKRRLFGRGEGDADGEAPAADDQDGEEASC